MLAEYVRPNSCSDNTVRVTDSEEVAHIIYELDHLEKQAVVSTDHFVIAMQSSSSETKSRFCDPP